MPSPTGIGWRGLEDPETAIIFGDLNPNESFPIWLWLHVNANAISRQDDAGTLTANVTIDTGGSGSGEEPGPGGGTGGNPPPTVANYKIAVAGDWSCNDTCEERSQHDG